MPIATRLHQVQPPITHRTLDHIVFPDRWLAPPFINHWHNPRHIGHTPLPFRFLGIDVLLRRLTIMITFRPRITRETRHPVGDSDRIATRNLSPINPSQAGIMLYPPEMYTLSSSLHVASSPVASANLTSMPPITQAFHGSH
jgi:hypothetical protein